MPEENKKNLLSTLMSHLLGRRGPYTVTRRGVSRGTIYLGDRFSVEVVEKDGNGVEKRTVLEDAFHSCSNPAKPKNGNILDLGEFWDGDGTVPRKWAAYYQPVPLTRGRFISPPKPTRKLILRFGWHKQPTVPADWEASDSGGG